MTVLGLCFDLLKEGDRTPYNVALHEFMIDCNSRDDPRVTPKPQHMGAWQSPEELLQFAIDIYGQHKPESLDRKQHVNFRPAVFNEPVPASIQTYRSELDGASPSLFATSEADDVVSQMDENAQLLATIHRRSSGGGGKPSWENNLGYHGSAAGGRGVIRLHVKLHPTAGKRRQDLFNEVKQARPVLPFKRGDHPPVLRPPRDAPRPFQRSKSTPPPRRFSAPMDGRPSLTRHNAASPSTMSDRHHHSSRTGAPDHQKTYFTAKSDAPRQREFLPPRAYAVVKEQKDLLEKTLNDSSSLSQQHLVLVLRKIQAGTSALMFTEEAMMTESMQQSSLDNDDSYNDDYHDATDDDPSPVFMEPPSSLSSEALHMLQALETSGFEGTPTEGSDAINSLIDLASTLQLHD